MSDVLRELSLARTALDDPGAILLPGEQLSRTPAGIYAVDRIDSAIGMLDVEENPMRALRTMLDLITEIQGDLSTHYLPNAIQGIEDAIEEIKRREGPRAV